MADKLKFSEEAELAFHHMTQEQKRLSVSMNSKNVLSQKQVRKELLCALCQAILIEPMKCVECKSHFHKACLNKFCRETHACPM